MALWTSEGATTVAAWTLICATTLTYLPLWHLLVGILICVNVLLILLIIISRLRPRDFRLSQFLFDILWSPFMTMFSYINVHQTEPHLQGERKLLPWERGIPLWVRRHAFVITLIALTSQESHDILLYISWIALFHSLLLLAEALFRLGNGEEIDLNYNLENEELHRVKVNQPMEEVDFSTRLWFYSFHVAICVLCVSYIFLSMTATDVSMTLTFVCVSHIQVQTQAMMRFRTLYPYCMDGLGELAVLGTFLLVDFVSCGRLFLLALCEEESSLLLICVTYCNAFAALMELRIRVWLRLRNERFLVQGMRWATEEEVMSYNDVCAICLVPMTTSARVTVCQHLFHGKCLRLSLKTNAQCPMCKATLLPAFGHGHIMF